MASSKIFEQALKQHEERLSALPNVVGLGIVDTPGGRGLAVAVYVSKKVSQKNLKRADRIPKRLVTGHARRRGWVPVNVIEQGIVELESIDG